MPYWPPLFPAVVTDMGGQVFNIKAYGAVCDGTTDDLAAWNAAIAAANNAGGGIVYLPGPVSAVSDTVVVENPGISIAAGWQNYVRTPVEGISGCRLIPTESFPTTGVPLVAYGISGAGSANNNNPHGGFVQGLGVSGLTLTGTAIAGITGIQQYDTSDVTYYGCGLGNCAGIGLDIESTVSTYGSLSPRVLACDFFGNGTHMKVDGTGATDGYIASCIFRFGTTTGVNIGATTTAGGGYLFENCHFTAANTTQVNHVLGTYTTGMVHFVNCYFDTISGSHIQGLTTAQINACYFQLSSSAGATQAAPVQMGGSNPRLTFTGNYLECNGNSFVKAFVQFYNISGSGSVAAFPDNSVMTGNIVRNGTGQPPASYLGIAIDGADIPLGSTAPAAQPLANATTYQNTYGQAMWVNQVVTMTTTASTASAATISVGPHGGTLVEADSFTLPSTVPQGIEYVLQARVPASWDYRLVLSNATAGTTTMTAEM